MIIKKYLAKTEKDAIEKAKEELGVNAIVMNVKKVHPHGIMRIFLRSKVEVTAALDENTSYSDTSQEKEAQARAAAATSPVRNGSRAKFDVSIPPLESLPPLEPNGKSIKMNEKTVSDPVPTKSDSESLSNEERLTKLFSLLEEQMKDQELKKNTRTASPARRDDAPERPPARKPAPQPERREPKRRSETSSKDELKDKLREASRASASNESAEEELPEEEKDKAAVYRDLIYKQLIQNEVDPDIAEKIIDEAKRSLPKDAAVDQILGSVYQRIILMIGQPYTINYRPNEPTKFVFFLGSTGVGKTTTIAKLASRLKLEQNCKLALVTADTYRVAAEQQLRVYADILSAPLYVVYHPEELGGMVDELEKYDVVLIDTAGCSHKNKEQIADVKTLLEQVPIRKRMVYLALSVGTKYKDLKEIAKVYSDITDYSIIFTKLDETSSAGVMLNMKLSTKCPLSYLTNGQEVPDDIERVDAQSVAKQLMS